VIKVGGIKKTLGFFATKSSFLGKNLLINLRFEDVKAVKAKKLSGFTERPGPFTQQKIPGY